MATPKHLTLDLESYPFPVKSKPTTFSDLYLQNVAFDRHVNPTINSKRYADGGNIVSTSIKYKDSAQTYDTTTAESLYKTLDDTAKAQLIEYVASGGTSPVYQLPERLNGLPDHLIFANASILCALIAQDWLDDLDKG